MLAIVILAAGESARMGRPKQNLIFEGKTLLQRAIETALTTTCKPVVVVLGANTGHIIPTLNYAGITIVQNDNWQEGMASSIRIAVKLLTELENVDSVLFTLCDQPFVTGGLIATMQSTARESGKAIVACNYNNTVGVPMLFGRKLFADLLLLQGQEGARNLVKQFPNDIATVLFNKGMTDIDTEEDYEELITNAPR